MSFKALADAGQGFGSFANHASWKLGQPDFLNSINDMTLAGTWQAELAKKIYNREIKLNTTKGDYRGNWDPNNPDEINLGAGLDDMLTGDAATDAARIASVLIHEGRHRDGATSEEEAYLAQAEAHLAIQQKRGLRDGEFTMGLVAEAINQGKNGATEDGSYNDKPTGRGRPDSIEVMAEAGDTFTVLARKYGMDYRELMRHNGRRDRPEDATVIARQTLLNIPQTDTEAFKRLQSDYFQINGGEPWYSGILGGLASGAAWVGEGAVWVGGKAVEGAVWAGEKAWEGAVATGKFVWDLPGNLWNLPGNIARAVTGQNDANIQTGTVRDFLINQSDYKTDPGLTNCKMISIYNATQEAGWEHNKSKSYVEQQLDNGWNYGAHPITEWLANIYSGYDIELDSLPRNLSISEMTRQAGGNPVVIFYKDGSRFWNSNRGNAGHAISFYNGTMIETGRAGNPNISTYFSAIRGRTSEMSFEEYSKAQIIRRIPRRDR